MQIEENPAGFQMACRPVVFCEPQQPTGRDGRGGSRFLYSARVTPLGVIPELPRGASLISQNPSNMHPRHEAELRRKQGPASGGINKKTPRSFLR